ncbi:MAG: type II toxin-antitoxin system HipA family toxin [Burkholderiaceae bacterium]
MESLSVFFDDRLIGALLHTEPLSFQYAPAWIADAASVPLHASMPKSESILNGPEVHVFFENLLPEGDQRRLISMRNQVTSVYGLLAAVGGDTAGNVTIFPAGSGPSAPVYQSLTWHEIHILLHANSATASELAAIQAKAAALPTQRLSISGAQHKMLLSIDKQGIPLRPMDATPSEFILKPDIVRNDIQIFASAINETIVMRAAKLCGMPVASVQYQPIVKACLVKRYDRVKRPDGTLQRIWQIDFCQAALKPSGIKYEMDGGPTFVDCYEILKRESAQPGVDQKLLLDWLFFNLYIGNNDSHAKNLSLLATDMGVRLAPFYDLMSTRVYPGLGPHFAFRIGGENVPGKMHATHIDALADALGVGRKYMRKLAKKMAARVETALPAAIEELSGDIGNNERFMLERLQLKIQSIMRNMRNRIVSG